MRAHDAPRPWIDREALAQEIRAAVGVKRVECRALGLFLDRLETALTHLRVFRERSPAAGFELHRELVLGIGAIANRVHVDENELADFVELVVDSALGLVSEAPGSGIDRVLLLEDLAQLWRDDRDETFWFVPERVAGLDLGSRERARVIARLVDGFEGADERTARRVGELTERLDPSGPRSAEG